MISLLTYLLSGKILSYSFYCHFHSHWIHQKKRASGRRKQQELRSRKLIKNVPAFANCVLKKSMANYLDDKFPLHPLPSTIESNRNQFNSIQRIQQRGRNFPIETQIDANSPSKELLKQSLN
ncbi:CLUMA_CG016840, isoform A [Clunio marinus]|uniref:CLUMA_CG016840, isoform A n=1 Tax=Clunio marinus TaxID=568069 RepID=A0A1J1ITC8_9DIPT|nr:CLUMA_CG016840, isoform A [Clunio marinus]